MEVVWFECLRSSILCRPCHVGARNTYPERNSVKASNRARRIFISHHRRHATAWMPSDGAIHLRRDMTWPGLHRAADLFSRIIRAGTSYRCRILAPILPLSALRLNLRSPHTRWNSSSAGFARANCGGGRFATTTIEPNIRRILTESRYGYQSASKSKH